MTGLSDIKDRSPNPDLIKRFEHLLEQAKSGEIRSAVYVVSFDDQEMAHGWAIDKRCSKRKVLSELLITQHEWITNIGLMEGDSCLSHALECKLNN